MRSALTVAALDLFVSKGYEATTVEDVVEVVGVARRTFFRYFRSKEDVIFPDHDERLAEVVEQLQAAVPSESALAVVCRTAEVVLEMYLSEPEVSLKRFELTRQVPSLRDKEIASIDRYQRVFTRFLRDRYAGEPNGELRAAVAASGVVATHNHVLRQWLRSGVTSDALADLRDGLALVQRSMGAEAETEAPEEQIVVSAVRTTASAAAVHEHLEQALRELPER